MNWSTYKFHASGLRYLMTNSRKKDDLSETTKTYLDELWIQETYGRRKTDTLLNKYMNKGTACETDSIELLERVTGKKYFKNQTLYENDYICGTPDVTKPDLIDVKTSWDLWTFAGTNLEDATKDYQWQMFGYEWMLKRSNSILVYALVDTPDEMVNDELYRLSFKIPEEQLEKYKNNYKFGDIPEKDRIKAYDFVFDETNVPIVIERVGQCRNYLLNKTL